MYFKKRQIWEEGLAEPVCSTMIEPIAWTGPFLDLSYLRGTLTLTFQCRVHLVLDRDSNAHFHSRWTIASRVPPPKLYPPNLLYCIVMVIWRPGPSQVPCFLTSHSTLDVWNVKKYGANGGLSVRLDHLVLMCLLCSCVSLHRKWLDSLVSRLGCVDASFACGAYVEELKKRQTWYLD